MKIAVTGATGFLGQYLVRHLTNAGHTCRCWYRDRDRCYRTDDPTIQWVPGELGHRASVDDLVRGCDAVVHSGLSRSGPSFRDTPEDLIEFLRLNFLGSVQLIEAARGSSARRFIYISSCAVHERILEDRALDENHPLRSTSHYGAHKAATEQFIHSFGFGHGYDICSLRPSGIYGLHPKPSQSKWYSLIRDVIRNQPVNGQGGGKEVHAADVASAAELLLHADNIAGEVFSCCDQYVARYKVASIAAELSGLSPRISGSPSTPRHQIVCDKLKSLGFQFGGEPRLRSTIAKIITSLNNPEHAVIPSA